MSFTYTTSSFIKNAESVYLICFLDLSSTNKTMASFGIMYKGPKKDLRYLDPLLFCNPQASVELSFITYAQNVEVGLVLWS